MIEIFGTLGPACDSPDILEQMFQYGMSGMRLNLSHSSLRSAEKALNSFHLAAKKAGKKADLLIDMQGPELRIGNIDSPYELRAGEHVFLSPDESEETVRIPQKVFEAATISDHVLIDDGKIELVIIRKDHELEAEVKRGGFLSSRKSVKIVGRDIHGPVLTETDLMNIKDAKEFGVTALMQPFVTSGRQLKQVREILDENGCQDIRIFAKIESRKGIAALEEIIPHADMIVIARGDLGNDMPLWQLPCAQKDIEAACLKHGKPFLVVTEMLASMVHSPVPTRAEMTDIFTAVYDGCSAVMVTNETAAGEYPAEVIRYLSNTVQAAGQWLAENNMKENMYGSD